MSKIFIDYPFLDKILVKVRGQSNYTPLTLILNPKFQEDVFKMREKYHIPKSKAFYIENNKYHFEDYHKWKDETDLKEFQKGVLNIRKKYKFKGNWHNFIDEFIAIGIFNPPLEYSAKLSSIIPGMKSPPRDSYNIESRVNTETAEIDVYIQVFPNTTVENLKKALLEIKQNNFAFKEKGSIKDNLLRYHYLNDQVQNNPKYNGKFNEELKNAYKELFNIGSNFTINEFRDFKKETKKCAKELDW